MPVIWVGLRKFDCRYRKGKEKGVGLAPDQWKQIFIDCNNHFLVEVTVLGICTEMMSLKVVSWDMALHHIRKDFALGYDTTSYPKRILSWDMTLHHIRKGFCPVF